MEDVYYSPIEPAEHGMLDAGDGHRVYWETAGNPTGVPIVFLHGGPGTGCSPNQRRFFDPDRFRFVLFDQRGSGRSRPLEDGSAPALGANTTDHLIADMESIRAFLGIDSWIVMGLSWGSTLGLAYALAHRDRVRGLLLGLVTTTSRREVDWITEGVGSIFPREWHRFAGAVKDAHRGKRLVDAYAAMLADPDPAVRFQTAEEWCRWEDAHVSLAPGAGPSPAFRDPDFRYRFARLVTHYWRNTAFRGGNELLDRADELEGIPGELIHGRFDVSSPLETAWELNRRWTTSNLTVIEDGGHGTGPSFAGALVGAVEELGRRSGQ